MLRVTLRPSRTLAGALALVHGAAAAVVIALDAPAPAAAALWTAIGTSCAYGCLRHARLAAPNALTALEIGDDGRAAVRTRTGTWLDVAILGTSYITPQLTLVNVRAAGSFFARHLIVVSDNANADDFRRLRVWLRWRHGADRGRAARLDAAIF